MNGLQDKTLLITGASRGIGKAIALRAAADGANVAIIQNFRPHLCLMFFKGALLDDPAVVDLQAAVHVDRRPAHPGDDAGMAEAVVLEPDEHGVTECEQAPDPGVIIRRVDCVPLCFGVQPGGPAGLCETALCPTSGGV